LELIEKAFRRMALPALTRIATRTSQDTVRPTQPFTASITRLAPSKALI
jgi:hypothetical protein